MVLSFQNCKLYVYLVYRISTQHLQVTNACVLDSNIFFPLYQYIYLSVFAGVLRDLRIVFEEIEISKNGFRLITNSFNSLITAGSIRIKVCDTRVKWKTRNVGILRSSVGYISCMCTYDWRCILMENLICGKQHPKFQSSVVGNVYMRTCILHTVKQ